jgi:hypothetical protein
MQRETKKRFLISVTAALIATCGPATMEMTGDVMTDGGMLLRDVGESVMDTGETGVDTGGLADDTGGAMVDTGEAMIDTGEMVRDVGSDAAEAQDCAMCTTGGAGRSITADTDGDRAVRITSPPVLSGPVPTIRFVELGAGPMFITDVVPQGSATAPPITVYSGTEPCDEGPDADEHLAIVRTDSVPELHGARLWVPAGHRVCALLSGTTAGSVTIHGYRPYD